MAARPGNIFEEATVEGTGQTTVNHTDIDTDPGSSPPDHVHIDHDLAHQACLREIASIFEDIQYDMRIIADRLDTDTKGVYIRQADTVANNPANIAQHAMKMEALKSSGQLDQINGELANPTNWVNVNPTTYASVQSAGAPIGGYLGGVGTTQNKPTGYAGKEVVTTPEGTIVSLPDAPFSAFSVKTGSATGKVKYGNAGSFRSLPIQQELYSIIEGAAATAKVDVLITSGGQVPKNQGGINRKNRTGSNRHDKGYGADVVLYLDKMGGKELYATNKDDLEIMLNFVQACANAGCTGIGIGRGYMNNRDIHVDIAWKGQQAGKITGILSNRYWGGGDSEGLPTKTDYAPLYLADIMETRDNIG